MKGQSYILPKYPHQHRIPSCRTLSLQQITTIQETPMRLWWICDDGRWKNRFRKIKLHGICIRAAYFFVHRFPQGGHQFSGIIGSSSQNFVDLLYPFSLPYTFTKEYYNKVQFGLVYPIHLSHGLMIQRSSTDGIIPGAPALTNNRNMEYIFQSSF